MRKFLFFIWVPIIIYTFIASIIFVLVSLIEGVLSTTFYYYILPTLVPAFLIPFGIYTYNNRLLHLESEKEKKYKKLLEKEKEEIE